jgi:hypothetical protein
MSASADSVIKAYPTALKLQLRGESYADAIKGKGLSESTFY